MNFQDLKNNIRNFYEHKSFPSILVVVFLVLVVVFYFDIFSISKLEARLDNWFFEIKKELMVSKKIETIPTEKYVSQISYEQAIIDTVAKASPSVVSIVISKNVPVYEQQFINPFGNIPGFNVQIPQNVQRGTRYQEVGAGSGFIVSEDGLIVTNKHVVLDKDADYTVVTTDGKKYSAKVLAINPVQDLAVIKIEKAFVLTDNARKFPAITLGDSDGIVIGQGAVAIGNALGEFSNTVSAGIVSGLQRTVSASGADGFSEILEGAIQTDAAINRGNSGGPLLNLRGEVIGVNTAMANDAQAVGFAIPINIVKRDLKQLEKNNKITYPFLGVHYVLITSEVRQKYKLDVDEGAYVLSSDGKQSAVVRDSAADKAGVKEKDIILEINGEKIMKDNSMARIVQKYSPGDKISLKILRNNQEIHLEATLGERD